MNDPAKLFSIVIQPRNWQTDTAGDVTLLEAARLAELDLPSSCRNGTCRTCMCRLLAGQVRYKIDWPGLSADEKAEGFILPCVAYPVSDVVIEVRRAVRRNRP
ncbi:MAG: 2Fe-2S iron-sulfur cluster-binding protein [Pseudomonadota bacterium]